MISNNPRQLETLKQVGAFLSVLEDPEKFKAMLKEAKETAERLEKNIAASTTVDKANEYFAAAQAAVNSAKDEVAKVKAEQAKIAADIAAKTAAFLEQQDREVGQLNAAKAALVAGQEELEAAKAAFEVTRQAQLKLSSELSAREAQLVQAEAAQRDRAAQIAALAKAA